MSKKITVFVAFDEANSRKIQEKGWESTLEYLKKHPKSKKITRKEFNSMEAAQAYIQGIEDGNGWNCPEATIRS